MRVDKLLGKDYTDYIASLQSAIDIGGKVQYTMSTDGWKEFILPLIERALLDLSSCEGITTLQELRGRQMAQRTVKRLLGYIESTANGVQYANEQLEEHLQSTNNPERDLD